jgi:hypothetical protein
MSCPLFELRLQLKFLCAFSRFCRRRGMNVKLWENMLECLVKLKVIDY